MDCPSVDSDALLLRAVIDILHPPMATRAMPIDRRALNNKHPCGIDSSPRRGSGSRAGRAPRRSTCCTSRRGAAPCRPPGPALPPEPPMQRPRNAPRRRWSSRTTYRQPAVQVVPPAGYPSSARVGRREKGGCLTLTKITMSAAPSGSNRRATHRDGRAGRTTFPATETKPIPSPPLSRAPTSEPLRFLPECLSPPSAATAVSSVASIGLR